MPHSRQVLGQFVWFSLAAQDPGRSLAFYGSLFGWTAHDLHVGGVSAVTVFRSGDHDVAGLVSVGQGPSRWLPFLAVDDVAASLSNARRLGGAVEPPSPGGPLATVVDPTGAAFCPAAAGGPSDPLADAAIPGHFCWSELLTTDPARAAAFYGALVGWTATEWDLGDQGRYWLFRRGDHDAAGMVPAQGRGERASCWLPYVQVVSAEE